MRTKTQIFIIALLLIMSIAGLLFYFNNSSDTAITTIDKEQPLQCNFADGDKHSFTISGTALSAISPERFMDDKQLNVFGNNMLKTNQEYKLKMHWQIDKNEADKGWIITSEISDFIMTATVDGKSDKKQISISYPFLMDIKDDCSFDNFRFHEQANPAYNKLLMSLILSLEMVLPMDTVSKTWQVERNDSLGRTLSAYKAVKTQSGEQLVTRKRLEYLNVFEQPKDKTVKVKIIKSTLKATLNPNASWFKRIDGTEHIRLAVNDSVFSESLATFLVLAIPSQFGVISVTNPDKYKQLYPGKHEEKRILAFADTKPPPDIANYKVPETLDRFQAILSSKVGGRISTALEFLTLYLRERPAAAMEIIDFLRIGQIDKKSESLVFLALQLADTKESEAALVSVLESSSFSPINQSQAIHALSEVRAISAKSVDMIFEASRGSLDGGNEELANRSLLALGVLGFANKEENPEIADRVVSEIESRFKNADSFSEKALVLAAIGNTRDERFTDEIEIGLTDESPQIRELSIKAASKIKSEEINTMLEEAFINDSDSVVRSSALNVLVTKDMSVVANEKIVELAAERLSAEYTKEAKSSIINYLGKNVNESTIAKEKLVKQYHNEKDPRLLILIGKYVSAEDLK